MPSWHISGTITLGSCAIPPTYLEYIEDRVTGDVISGHQYLSKVRWLDKGNIEPP